MLRARAAIDLHRLCPREQFLLRAKGAATCWKTISRLKWYLTLLVAKRQAPHTIAVYSKIQVYVGIVRLQQVLNWSFAVRNALHDWVRSSLLLPFGQCVHIAQQSFGFVLNANSYMEHLINVIYTFTRTKNSHRACLSSSLKKAFFICNAYLFFYDIFLMIICVFSTVF